MMRLKDDPPIGSDDGSRSANTLRRDRLGAFVGDRSGTSAVEFAIVCLPLFALFFLIFQVALYHFSLQSLDHATRQASRQVMIGSIQGTATSAAAFRTAILCPKFLLAFSCDRVKVNAYKVDATSNAATDSGIYKFVDARANALRLDATETSFCLGGASDYVFLDVTYDFPNFLGTILSAGNGTAETFMLRSTTFFRNEPFTAAAAPC